MNPRYAEARQCLNDIIEDGLLGKKLRPAQIRAITMIIHLIYQQNKKYIVLTAPTGAGKSLIAAAVALICRKVDKWHTNLTTSNRALQKQYGDDLSVDNRFKVIMGTQNYRCSLYFENEDDGTCPLSTCGNSLCGKFDLGWGVIKSAMPFYEKIHGKYIETSHKDQDEAVIEESEGNLNEIIATLSTMQDGIDKHAVNKKELPATTIKKICKEKGSCSFYVAREAAENAPIAIRSIQHMAFYIMFGVEADGLPILQARELHIHDECHHIDRVFRDMFRCSFSERYYKATLTKALDDIKLPGLLGNFSEVKKTPGKEWAEVEQVSLAARVEADLAKVVEATLMSTENSTRSASGTKPMLRNAKEFLKASISGELLVSITEYSESKSSIMQWYKNISHANADHRMYSASKAKGHKYNKRYASSVVSDESGVSLNIFPIVLDGMVKRYLGEKHTIYMSATPQTPKVFEGIFGLEKEVGYVEVESDFPPESSPIFWEPVDKITTERAKEIGDALVAKKSFKTAEERRISATSAGYQVLYARLSEKIREILEYYKDSPGIIPCPSYTMVRELKENLKDNHRFIWVEEGKVNRSKVTEFKKRAAAGESVILVSAGIAEGHSFNDDISRLQIIPKMPMPAKSAEITELTKRWHEYYTAQTAITLQQMVGRSMRSKDDYCVTIVLDQKFDALKSEKVAKAFYSKHFVKCIQWGKSWKVPVTA